MRKKDSLRSRKNAVSFYSQLYRKEKERFRKAARLLEDVKESLLPLKEKHGIGLDELFSYAEEQLFFPITVINRELTVLESTVKYLKERKRLSLRKISRALGRDERNIWHIYDNAKKKVSEQFKIKNTEFWVPVSIFPDTELSALESIVSYLKDECSLKYHEIALLLKRDDRTIWTVYQRARRKNAKPE